MFAWWRPCRSKCCIIILSSVQTASIFLTKILIAAWKLFHRLTSNTQSSVFSDRNVNTALTARVTEGDQMKLEKVMDGERDDIVQVSERMRRRAKHSLMFFGSSSLLFRMQAGMVNIQGYSNQGLWSQQCWEMMLMTQWCQNTKEYTQIHTHLLLHVNILACTVHK